MVRNGRMNFSIFQSGKVIISGVKNIKAARDAFLPILLNMGLCQKD
jgi:TATA-box binding protein (TBP) (component of TFIID and TFIIIB)